MTFIFVIRASMIKTFLYITAICWETSLLYYICVFSWYFFLFLFWWCLFSKTHDYIFIMDYIPYDYLVTSHVCFRWDGWMASQTQWTWVWVDSRSWWWTGTWLSDWTELNMSTSMLYPYFHGMFCSFYFQSFKNNSC